MLNVSQKYNKICVISSYIHYILLMGKVQNFTQRPIKHPFMVVLWIRIETETNKHFDCILQS